MKVVYEEEHWRSKSTFLKDFCSRLIKSVDSRMSLCESISHIWINQGEKKRRLQKLTSQITTMHEDFH